MKPAGIRYVTLLAIFLLASALAWTSLIEARGPAVSASRLMNSARLFEKQGRSSKAVELYRRVLRAEPGHTGATAALVNMRAKAVAVLRSTEMKPQSTSKITLVEAVKPIRKTQSAEPAVVRESVGTRLQRKSRSIGSGISGRVAGLIPARRKTEVTEGSDAATSAAIPKRTFPKTREVLSEVGKRLRGDRRRSAATPPVVESAPSVESLPLIPPTDPASVPVPAVKVILPDVPVDADAGTIKEIARTPESVPVPVAVPVAVATPAAEPESIESVPVDNRVAARTRSAWGKIRERFAAKAESETTPRSAKTPLWTRLGESLKRTRERLAMELGLKSTAAVDAVDAVEPETVSEVKSENPVLVVTEPKVAIANPAAVIPAKSMAERIGDAAAILAVDANDAAARKVLVDAVSTSPDVEASLAAYMLGTRASGYPDVMTALGEQMSVRTGMARVHMAEAMLQLDGNHVAATDTLVVMVSSKEMEVRMMSAFAMQSATVDQRERCISALIKALDDSESDVRAAAALTLGSYGPVAKAALPELVRLVHDENVDTGRAAGVALQCIEPPPGSAQVDTRVTPVAAEADQGQ